MSQSPICILYFDTLLRQNLQNFTQKFRNPFSYSHFRNRVFAKVGRRKTLIFSFLFFYYVYRGLKGFLNVSFRPCLTTPQKGKSLQMGPQNTLKQLLRHYKIRYLRAFRSYFCPNRSCVKQRFGTSYERVALNRT